MGKRGGKGGRGGGEEGRGGYKNSAPERAVFENVVFFLCNICFGGVCVLWGGMYPRGCGVK